MAQESLSLTVESVGKHDVQAIKAALDTLAGVTSVSVNDCGKVAVDYDNTGVTKEDITRKLQTLGYQFRRA